jgi:UDP-N-acetylmuramoyl-L-alanyl-D-glutamate--2,6-diaminopimelate ligase
LLWKLAELIGRIPNEFWARPPEVAPDLVIRGICHDSRSVRPGDLFVALSGQRTDGVRYLGDAQAAGAAAFLVEERGELSVTSSPVLRAHSARQVMGLLAAVLHGEPSRSMRLVGVTGTDGKTSTTWLVRHILAASGRRAVAAGTLGIKGDREDCMPWSGGAARGDEVHRHWQPTTPESPVFQETLARLHATGVQDVVAEISSHALAQERIFGTQFAAVALTHVAADHLDFHGTRDDYLAAKARLFDPASRGGPLETQPVQEILNLDDDLGRALAAERPGRCLTVGRDRASQVRLDAARTEPGGLELELCFAGEPATLRAPLSGAFHTENLLVASAIAFALGLAPEAIVRAAATVQTIPGRFESIREGQSFAVIVDYAHTPDGLRNLLQAARSVASGKLILVFGCGGDRDASKREPMGRAAAELADHVIVTDDNPRSEDSAAIGAQIAEGLRAGTATWEQILDRRSAFARAISLARADDMIVAAGRGSEPTQVFRDRTVVFDDRDVLRGLLREQRMTSVATREGGDGGITNCRVPGSKEPATRDSRRAPAGKPHSGHDEESVR